MRIAIIGTGISGLTAANLLRQRHEITVFEANDYIGGHTNTVRVQEDQRTIPVDTGFIVFNQQNYPNLCKLFAALEVKSRNTDMSFSVHCERSGLEYNGSSLSQIFIQKRNLVKPEFWWMLKDILRFHKQAQQALANGLNDHITVSAFVEQNGYSKHFVEHYLVPLGASLWSCPANRFCEYPMRFVIEFLHNHNMLQVEGRPAWKTVQGGSAEYVKCLVSDFRERIYLNRPVKKIIRGKNRIQVWFDLHTYDEFDEVIVATHANQALSLVQNIDQDEDDLLSHFEYQMNDTVLHTDEKVLPSRPAAWASWNYRIPQVENGHGTVSYNMNMLQGIDSKKTYCVSLNQTRKIDPEKIIYRVQYQHPQFSPGRDEVQNRHAELIRRNGISYCGAYWGFGFHEDGVSSALRVCQAYGLELH